MGGGRTQVKVEGGRSLGEGGRCSGEGGKEEGEGSEDSGNSSLGTAGPPSDVFY